jgi:hypothetical protein
MAVYIYGLFCPLTGELRYIGKSIDPEHRIRRHLDAARNPKNYNQRWIATLLRKGIKPTIRVLREVGADEIWQDVERAMIAEAKAGGARLTNTAIGGEGVLIDDPRIEARRKRRIAAAWSNPALRAQQSARVKAAANHASDKRAARSRAMWADPEYAAKVSEALKVAYATPEARAAQSQRSSAAHKCPDVQRRRAAGISAAWNLEGARDAHAAAIKESLSRPEVKERKSETVKRRHADPEQKARMMRGLSDPEMIKRRNAAIRAGWARRLAASKE